jgi:hypothetical protein
MGTFHFVPTAVIAAQFAAILTFPFVAKVVAIIARIIFIGIIFIIVNHCCTPSTFHLSGQFVNLQGETELTS